MVETIVVALVVGAVLLLAARSLHRTLSGKDGGCGCRGSSCPLSDSCDKAPEMKPQERTNGR